MNILRFFQKNREADSSDLPSLPWFIPLRESTPKSVGISPLKVFDDRLHLTIDMWNIAHKTDADINTEIVMGPFGPQLRVELRIGREGWSRYIEIASITEDPREAAMKIWDELTAAYQLGERTDE